VRAPSRSAATLARGKALLAAFQVEEALPLLERALAEGPHEHAELATIYEQLGIAYAYLEREQEALGAFDLLLDLEPGHLLSYELSPKATFLFERARRAGGAAPAVDLDWPDDGSVDEPLPIDVEVIADPRGFLRRGTLHLRRRGDHAWRALDLSLLPPGRRARARVPPLASGKPEVLELYLTVSDPAGNEVLLWADAARPRAIPLGWEPPPAWWERWWVWAIVGGVAVVGASVTVYAVTYDEPTDVGGIFDSN
jgi:tetratricopeptide (TPR) repeat protein